MAYGLSKVMLRLFFAGFCIIQGSEKGLNKESESVVVVEIARHALRTESNGWIKYALSFCVFHEVICWMGALML